MTKSLQNTVRRYLRGAILIALCAIPAGASIWTNEIIASVFPIDTTSGEIESTALSVFSLNLGLNPSVSVQLQEAGNGLYQDLGSARIGNGAFGLYASASGHDNGGAETASEVDLVDTLTSNGFAIVVPITVDGLVDTPIHNTIYSTVDLRFGIGCSFTSNPSVAGSSCGGNSLIELTTGESFQETFTLTIPTLPGRPVYVDFDSALEAYVNTNQPAYITGQEAPSADETADFSHTGVFGPAVVLDESGNIMPDGTITLGLGIDYMNASSSTPEPATLGAASAGLALLALWRVGRKGTRS
jgi:hypothetical protein